MKQIISKEELDGLMKTEGQGRGLVFKTEEKFILNNEGEEGKRKVEETITGLGHPFRYSEIKPMHFYPVGLQGLSFLAIQRLFDYPDEKFQELGMLESKTSPFIVRLYVHYFVSLPAILKRLDFMWQKHFTTGRLNVIEYSEKEKYLVFRCEGFKLHPIHCHIIMGYVAGAVEMILKDKKVICEETKCIHRGDEYHEFLVKW